MYEFPAPLTIKCCPWVSWKIVHEKRNTTKMHLWLQMGILIKILQSLCHGLWRTLRNEKLKSNMRFSCNMKILQLILWNIYHVGFITNFLSVLIYIEHTVQNFKSSLLFSILIRLSLLPGAYKQHTGKQQIKLYIPFHQPTELQYMNIHNNSFSTMKIICSKTNFFFFCEPWMHICSLKA